MHLFPLSQLLGKEAGHNLLQQHCSIVLPVLKILEIESGTVRLLCNSNHREIDLMS